MLNRVFHTNILSNATETLQFEDLAVKNIIFKKMSACSRAKSQIVSVSTFDEWKVLIFKYFDK